MMQQEFEKLTKVKVTSEEYNVIEAAYMACQEDKQVFCKQWLKKDGIRNLLKDRLAKAETRKPLYVSESFNYARFDVLCKGGHMQWELVDGKLCDYESPNI